MLINAKLLFSIILLATLTSCFFNTKNIIDKKLGTVILLNGTSSSGKTSILKALQNIHQDNYIYLNADSFADEYSVNNKIDESMARDAINRQILGALFLQVKQLSSQGKNVFVDVVEFDNHYDYYCSILDCSKIIKVLVYCPLDVIINRVEMRNKSGDIKENRPLNLSFWQFKDIYKLQESSDEKVVDRIETSHMKYALQEAEKEVLKLMKESGVKEEDLKKNISLFSNPFSDHFKLDAFNEIVLVPKHSWDLIVNTAIESPEEIAKKISQY